MLDRPPPTPVRVAGNLPYNVASPILFTLLELFMGRHPARRRDGHAAAGGRRRLAARPGAGCTAC